MNLIKVRRACPDEAQALSDIAIRSKRSNGYSDSFMDACRDELTVAASDIQKDEYWVAEAQAVVGFVCLADTLEPSVGMIHSFFIDPTWRRRGIGKLLWHKVAERARSSNIQTIHLDSDPSAVAFYESLGFRVTGEVPSGSIVGRTIPRMELCIPD